MKVFIRILSYADFIVRRLVFFFLYSVLGIVFSVFNIVLVMPMLKLLFDKGSGPIEVPPIPSFGFSADYVTGLFNHYNALVIRDYGTLNALLFVCGLIVLSMALANVFRFLERVMATKIRVDLVKNIRMDIFKKVSLLHIGYFNNERKGDLMSRFTNDVLEVESAIMNSLNTSLF